MISLDLVVPGGAAVYLDIQRIEARQKRGEAFYALSGTLGDGLYEGEVLVEIGEQVEVTFIDEWLGGSAMADFFRRVERQTVNAALITAAARMRFCIQNFPALEGEVVPWVAGYHFEDKSFALRPQEYAEQLELPLAMAEESAIWQRRVA